MGIVSLYSTRPDELKPGDVLVCTVTLQVGYHIDKEGKPMYRIYRCDYPPQVSEDGIPQGSRIPARYDEEVVGALFPVVQWAGLKPD